MATPDFKYAPMFQLGKDETNYYLLTKEGIISAYESAKKKGIDYDIYKKVYEALPSMTLADIVKFEQETMAGKPRRYLILGNEDELDMEALGKIGKIHRLTTEQIFGY